MITNKELSKKQILLVIGGLIIFALFLGSVFGDNEPETPKRPANIEAIKADLNVYGEGRWLETQVANSEDGILIRVTTGTEVTINETAAGLYCDEISSVLDRHAPDHKRESDVFIYQLGEIVKTCVF